MATFFTALRVVYVLFSICVVARIVKRREEQPNRITVAPWLTNAAPQGLRVQVPPGALFQNRTI
jgi:hypothetical protein